MSTAGDTEFLVDTAHVEMPDVALGLRLADGASMTGVNVSVRTSVMRCLYWQEDMHTWTGHGCLVRSP